MKKIVLCLCALWLCGCGSQETATEETAIHSLAPGTEVWVCMSPNATKFHTDSACGGLKRCKAQVEKQVVEKAEAAGLAACSYKKCR